MSSLKPQTRPQLTLGLALLAGFSLSILIAAMLLVLTATGIAFSLFYQFNTITQTAKTTPMALLSQAITGWQTEAKQTNGYQNILILGTDTLSTRGDVPPLTDTIMLATLELKTGKINLLSFPRDLWSEKWLMRINALYARGIESNREHPTQLITQEIAELAGVPIHYTIVTSLETVGQLIDLVGGVEVNVAEGFTDTRFPRTDVDVTVVTDSALLYETVEFEPGVQTMSGETALKFIRSRKSFTTQGNDEARAARQQLVIQALTRRLQQLDPVQEPTLVGHLYSFYAEHFAQYLPVTDAIATAKVILPHAQQLQLAGHGLSIYPEDPQGAIFHPPESSMNGAWVYRIKNRPALQTEIQVKLGQPQSR